MKNKENSVSQAFSIAAITILAVSLLVVNYAWQRKTAWAEKLNNKLIKKELELDQVQRNLLTLKHDMDALNQKLTAMVSAASIIPIVPPEPIPAAVLAPVPAVVAPEVNTKS